eukprot:TRINITY_DN18153_c0_g1_i3.p1 TRINITY_DN18153_c0_g1~~TRINITY_DN18153_c0_g1_i3.p1  ORF type:complete len:601 (-),score=74.82 TRINITY_DN18153_c0_g1_i3:113-1837(-)
MEEILCHCTCRDAPADAKFQAETEEVGIVSTLEYGATDAEEGEGEDSQLPTGLNRTFDCDEEVGTKKGVADEQQDTAGGGGGGAEPGEEREKEKPRADEDGELPPSPELNRVFAQDETSVLSAYGMMYTAGILLILCFAVVVRVHPSLCHNYITVGFAVAILFIGVGASFAQAVVHVGTCRNKEKAFACCMTVSFLSPFIVYSLPQLPTMPDSATLASAIVLGACWVGNFTVALFTNSRRRIALASLVGFMIMALTNTQLVQRIPQVQERIESEVLAGLVPSAVKALVSSVYPAIVQAMFKKTWVQEELVGTFIALFLTIGETLGLLGFVTASLRVSTFSDTCRASLSMILSSLCFEVFARSGVERGLSAILTHCILSAMRRCCCLTLRCAQLRKSGSWREEVKQYDLAHAWKLAAKTYIGYVVLVSFIVTTWMPVWFSGAPRQEWWTHNPQVFYALGLYFATQSVCDLTVVGIQRRINHQPGESWLGSMRRVSRVGGTLAWGRIPEVAPLPNKSSETCICRQIFADPKQTDYTTLLHAIIVTGTAALFLRAGFTQAEQCGFSYPEADWPKGCN